jgi:TatA/E family protein of Tat protein translocase
MAKVNLRVAVRAPPDQPRAGHRYHQSTPEESHLGKYMGFLPSGSEWLIILVIVLIIFGGSHLPGLFKALGQGVKEFRMRQMRARS